MTNWNFVFMIGYTFILFFILYTHKEPFVQTSGEKPIMSFKLVTTVNRMPYYIGVANNDSCNKLNDTECIDKLILTTEEKKSATFDLVEDIVIASEDTKVKQCHICLTGNKYLKIKDKYVTKCCKEHLCMYTNKNHAAPLCFLINPTNSVSIRDINECKYVTVCKALEDKESDIIGEECIQMCLALREDKMSQFLIVDKKIY